MIAWIKNIMSLPKPAERDRWAELSAQRPCPEPEPVLAVTDLVAPRSAWAEAALLGSMLIVGAPVRRVAEICDRNGAGQLVADDFHVPFHRRVWETMLTLDARDVPIDVVTVSDEMRERRGFDDDELLGYVDRQDVLGYFERMLVTAPAVDLLARYVQIVHSLGAARRMIDAIKTT